MAQRDVQLVIRAKDEASRALASVAELLGQLDIKQKGAAASGKSFATSAVEAAQQLAQFERVTGLVVAASDRAEQAIARQRAAIAGTAAELASVSRQIAAAREAINAAQTRVVDARLAGGDGAAQVSALQAAQQAARDLEQQQGRLTTKLAQQEGALEAQERGFRELASQANTAEAALTSFGDEAARTNLKAAAASEESTRALRQQAEAARELADQQRRNDQFSAFLGVRDTPANSASASAAVFEDAERQAQALQRLQDRLDPLAAIQRRVAVETDLLNKAQARGALTSAQYDAALANLTKEAGDAEAQIRRVGRGERGAPALFGLKPYELTNLGYQINDLITQVASGTSVFQALAQQGGQILQLIPNIGARLTAAFSSPPFLIAAAIFGGIALSVKEAADQAERLRTMEALLSSIGEEAGVTAEQLSAIAAEIEVIGLNSSEATGLVRTFLTQGLNTDYLIEFAETARDFADVTGKDIPDALDAQRTAFTRGYEAVAELDNQIGFLTVAERDQIRAMFDSGEAAEAREKAFAIFRREMDEQAGKMRGSWSSAVRTLDRSFTSLLETLGRADFAQGLLADLDKVIQDIEFLFTRTDELTRQQLERQIAQIKDRQKRLRFDPLYQAVQARSDAFALAEYEKALERVTKREGQRAKAEGDLRDEQSAAAQKRERDQLRLIQRENQIANARTAAQRIALAGEKAYQEAIDAGHSKRVAQARREQAIERQRRDEERKAAQERKKDADKITLRSPLDGNPRVSSGFSLARRNPVTGRVQPHTGVDYAVPTGTALRAPADGVVRETGNRGARGKFIVLDLGKGTQAEFYHLSDNEIVKAGQLVSAGDLIGRTGNTGRSTGPHLHYKLTVNGKPVDPTKLTQVRGGLDDAVGNVAADLEKRIEAQDALNEKIDSENEARRRSTEFQREQLGLSGEALLNAQREQAVQEALIAARDQARQRGSEDLEVSEERLKAIRETVEAEFDIANARERATAALDDATALRDSLLGELDIAEQIGDPAQIRAVETEIARVDAALRGAIEQAITLYETFGGNTPQAQATIRNLRNQAAGIGLETRDRTASRLDKPVNDLQAQRNALIEQVAFYRELGQDAVTEQLREQLRGVEQQLLAAADASLVFWQTQSGPEAQTAILNLQNLRNQVLAAQNEFTITAGQIQDAFAGSLSDAFQTFAQRLVETRDPLQALGESALQFAADFTRKLAEMGLEILAFQVASKIGFGGFAEQFNSVLGTGSTAASAAALGAAGGAVAAGGAAISAGATLLTASAGAIQAAAAALAAANATGTAGIFHAGGIAGAASRSRAVHPAWFAAATRYHSGGIAGLRPNEVPTILERGEEILTRSDPRHRFNAPGLDGQIHPRSQTDILAIGDDEIANAMAGASGERVVMRILRRNKETVRSMVNE